MPRMPNAAHRAVRSMRQCAFFRAAGAKRCSRFIPSAGASTTWPTRRERAHDRDRRWRYGECRECRTPRIGQFVLCGNAHSSARPARSAVRDLFLLPGRRRRGRRAGSARMTEIAAGDTANAANAERRASGSSFYAAMRILPRGRREALFEIYSFCRAVDDVADAQAPREPRLRELTPCRADIEALYGGETPARVRGPVEPGRTYGLTRDD